MSGFDLSPEQRDLQQRARALAEGPIAQRAAEVDRTEQYPWDNVELLKDAKLIGMTIPPQYGGQGRGWLDAVLSRGMDTLISIPSKLFALIMVAAFGTSVPLLVMTAAIIYVPGAYRIARALAVNVAALDYVVVARTRGESRWYLMLHEVLPNIAAPMLVDLGLRFVYVVLLLASLSFLGLGVQPPAADWGTLVRENLGALWEGGLAVVAPALAIATLTMAVNLVVDALPGRDARKAVH